MADSSEFKNRLSEKIAASLNNNFHDNFEYNRFGHRKNLHGLKELLRRKLIYPNYIAKWMYEEQVTKLFDILIGYFDDLADLYKNLNDQQSKDLIVDIIAYRILGFRHVKLPVNNGKYWDLIKKAEALIIDRKDYIKSDFLNCTIYKYDLRNIGYDLYLYFFSFGIVTNFMLEQYCYKNDHVNISVKEGDVVIDAGGCWGDTALYFASKVKEKGKVYSFEFIPGNIEIFNKNIQLNHEKAGFINLINYPLWDENDKDVYFIDQGPSSLVSFEKMDRYSGKTKTITIDKFVEENNVPKVDFVKMDIEGAEPKALLGALNTIKKHKPDLAISIYHSMDDFTKIPKWINDLNLGYKLYLGHYTIYAEETVIFATID